MLVAAAEARAQANINLPQPSIDWSEESRILDRYPQRPSQPPAFTIPLGPLGFHDPGPFFLLRRQSLASLDFLDENRILFTFRASGLIQRGTDNDDKVGKDQQIRAVVLALEDGKIESGAKWIVPDRARYLWVLRDGHILLRVRDGLDQGDASLKMTPYLRSPGQLLWLEMDPSQQLMITNSLETENATQKVGEPDALTTAQTDLTTMDRQKQGAQSVVVARTLRRDSGQVLRVSRVPWTHQTEDWPMNSEGYLERSRDSGQRWLLTLNYFAGGSRVLARVDSICSPTYSFVSETELFVTACDAAGGSKLQAMSTRGDLLWDVKTATNAIWPLLIAAPSGSRVARETLLLKHSVDRYHRLLSAKDFNGQMVRVLDAANAKVVLEAPLTPALDGGGNVAISPSGRRIAILNAGAIQIFQLPAAALPRP